MIASTRRLSKILGLMIAAVALLVPAAADAREKRQFKPTKKTAKALVFDVGELEGSEVRKAKLRLKKVERVNRDAGAVASGAAGQMRKKRKFTKRKVTRQVRRAAGEDRNVRFLRTARVRRGRLKVVVEPEPEQPTEEPAPSEQPQEPAPAPAPQEGGDEPQGGSQGGAACEFVGISSCNLLNRDDGTGDPADVWGRVDCADSTRATNPDGFRRLTVIDGDDLWGERCELARNEHRYGNGGGNGTFHVYREGERKITMMSIRLPQSLPVNTSNWTWQVVTQMKQAQPSDNGGGTPVIALHAAAGKWRLYQSKSSGPSSDTQQLWSAPAQHDVWTRVAFDITYSQDPSKGSVRMFVDVNGDGDATDPGEASDPINTYTLKRETATNSSDGMTNDGVAEGESIPSHLRIGPYHDESFDCPPPGGCAVEYDNIEVFEPTA